MKEKKIHQIWYQGTEQVPEKYKSNIASVIKNNPDYEYNIWDGEDIRSVVKSLGDKYLQRWDSLELLHQKVDYGRYAILLKYGGVSVDIDAMALKSFNETPHLNDSDFIVSRNSTNSFINNATILVSKENPLMKELIDEIDGDCKFYQGDTSCVMYSTGPKAFTKFVEKNVDKITVLDNKYFEGCSGMNRSCALSPDAILNHQHEGSWVNPVYRKVVEIFYDTKKYHAIIFVILLLIILWAIFKK